ncbi:helix-turn-helix transcriptional regulator [Streptomyces sp. NPDC058664]|uniref:helix-turn-helix transcriptional regulator n=1 Tax=unclassified Streptomyces TaxID=2593676 RepID=UPI003658AB48
MDWHALRTLAPGRRSPLAALDPIDPQEGDTAFLAEVARMTGVGRAAVQHWRRRHADFPTPIAGTDIHPRFERAAVVAWLLAHDKIALPTGVPSATLTLWSDAAGERHFRLDDPVLELADDEAKDDHLSGWMDDDTADALAALTTAQDGASVRRLTAPATPPLAVPGRGGWSSATGPARAACASPSPGPPACAAPPHEERRAARSATSSPRTPPARCAGAHGRPAAAWSHCPLRRALQGRRLGDGVTFPPTASAARTWPASPPRK